MFTLRVTVEKLPRPECGLNVFHNLLTLASLYITLVSRGVVEGHDTVQVNSANVTSVHTDPIVLLSLCPPLRVWFVIFLESRSGQRVRFGRRWPTRSSSTKTPTPVASPKCLRCAQKVTTVFLFFLRLTVLVYSVVAQKRLLLS